MDRAQETTTSVTRRVVQGAAALLAFGATVLAAAPDVHAAPLGQDRWHEAGSENQLQCGDLETVHFWDVSGSALLVTQGPDGLAHYRQTLHYTEGWTNPVTGRTFRLESSVAGTDVHVTNNGDGTLTIESQGAGVTRYYAGSTMLFLDSGLVRWRDRVDHAGTPGDPSDDTFLEFLGVEKELTGHSGTAGRSFCDDLRFFTS